MVPVVAGRAVGGHLSACLLVSRRTPAVVVDVYGQCEARRPPECSSPTVDRMDFCGMPNGPNRTVMLSGPAL